jgi:hypothetical protein
MKSGIAALLAGLAVIVAAVAPANAMMLDEFDELGPFEKGKVIADAIGRIQSHVADEERHEVDVETVVLDFIEREGPSSGEAQRG